MARLYTALQIATSALAKIGAFSARDAGPDPDELERAIEAFDLILQEQAGVRRLYWLAPVEFSVPLVAGQTSYDLQIAMGAAWPATGIQFPIKDSAYLVPPVTPPTLAARIPLVIVRRAEYYAATTPVQAGQPEMVWFDRSVPTLQMKTSPVIALAGYTLNFSAIVHSPDLVSEKKANVPHGLPNAWQRWAVFATAADIGGGDVRELAGATIARFERIAMASLKRLLAYNATEHASRRAIPYRDL